MNTTTYHKRRDQRREQRDRSFGRGFACGFILACAVIAAFLIGQERAYGNTAQHANIAGTITDGRIIKLRIGSGAASSWAVYHPDQKTMPPGWRTFLRICQLEQPGNGWRGVWWTNREVNHSFPGGCGLTRQNYTEVKHPAWPDTADQLSARDQLWASFWLFWKHARIGQDMRGSYQGGQRYGSTVWDVHDQPGLLFDGFRANGKTPA